MNRAKEVSGTEEHRLLVSRHLRCLHIGRERKGLSEIKVGRWGMGDRWRRSGNVMAFSISREKTKESGERDGPGSPLKILRGGASSKSTDGTWEVRGLEGDAPQETRVRQGDRVFFFYCLRVSNAASLRFH